MIIKKARIAVFLMIFTLFLGACGADDCEEFSNEVHPTLREGLRHHLRGFLDYNTWILISEDGDSLIIRALSDYEEQVTTTQAEGDPICDKYYEGKRTYQYSYITKDGDFENIIEYRVYSTSRTSHQISFVGRYSWNNNRDSVVDKRDVIFLDSIMVNERVFYNAQVPLSDNDDFPNEIYVASNEAFGFIVEDGTIPKKAFVLDTVY
jgi:hypothetical protein